MSINEYIYTVYIHICNICVYVKQGKTWNEKYYCVYYKYINLEEIIEIMSP